MAEMTPREQAQAVRQQSRTLIATLRADRRAAAVKVSAPREPRKGLAGPESSRTARLDRRGAPAEQTAPTMERRTREAERLRREATRNRLAVAEEIKRLRDARWDAKMSGLAAKAAPGKAAPGKAVPGKAALRAAGVSPAAAAKPPVAKPPVANPLVAKPAAAFASAFPGGFAQKAKAPPPPRRASLPKADTRPPLDIDTISGLGTALKSKLRRLGLGTVEKLAAQQPEQLRKQLGPAGRLVNIEALIRTARTTIGATPSASRGRRP